MTYQPISDYGIIGNKLSVALVSSVGSIDWCCLPHFDSPSTFAAILDDKRGGRFSIRPRSVFTSRQSYLPNTNLLEIVFQTDTGTVTLTDFMPCYRNSDGSLNQPVQIHRLLRCTEGEIEMEAVFEPQFDYARATTHLERVRYGIMATGGQESVSLSSRLNFEVTGSTARSRFTLTQREDTELVVHYGAPLSPAIYHPRDKLVKTKLYWQEEAKEGTFYGLWHDPILRSYLTLHLLVYQPTGAIIAAPTTSLPEEAGGERNWDYRYSWLRDTSMILSAFQLMGHKDEAASFMGWLSSVCGVRGPEGQTLYAIDLKKPPDEEILSHLRGYRDSRPVRIGNAAYRQQQLDVFGEVLEAAYNYLNIRGYISQKNWKLLEAYVDSACKYWRQPDDGIWEVRSGSRHFVHSKLMCWVALDRGIRIGQRLGYSGKLKRWRNTAHQIREDILTRGWKEGRKSFTQHYDTEAVDASQLLLPLYGLLPVSDERIVATVARIQEELGWDGLLRRYNPGQTDDGIAGGEGAFLACSAWLVRDLIRLNRLDEAVSTYERLLRCGNHLGLFPEMFNPDTGEALGNFPQALTHLSIITAGLELNQATLWGW